MRQKDLEEIAEMVAEEAKMVDLLLKAASNNSDEPTAKRTADNAAWALQHLKPEDAAKLLLPKKDTLINITLESGSATKQRILLSILREMPTAKDEVRPDLVDFCLNGMLNCSLPAGLRAQCIHQAYKQCRHYPELQQELKRQLQMMEDDLLQPALKSAKKNTLKLIAKNI